MVLSSISEQLLKYEKLALQVQMATTKEELKAVLENWE